MASTTSWFGDPQGVLEILQDERRERARLPELPNFEVLHEIGRGGQGLVFLARQISTQRRVALKVLLDGIYASAASRRRFERELEIILGLRHPNIVQVLSRGVTPDARPYLVMEFVEGVSLERWAAQRLAPPLGGAALKTLCGVFAKICDAVNYAHQHGVIHRDLKPGNILVDAGGEPHVLDFGLARPVAPGSGVTMTATGQFFGSLPWASPEQVRGNRAAVDIRSDVYSLGVMLYQALTGRAPYDVSGGMQVATHNIAFTEPPKPHDLNPEIDADLQAVLLRALEKDPLRRYQTVGELAVDLRAWAAGQPVQARGDSGWYVIRKVVRRHRLPLGIGAAVLVVGIVYALTISVLFHENSLARERAEAALARTAKVNDFLGEILTTVDPSHSGYRVTVAEVLDRAESEARQRFASEPEIDASIALRIGESFLNLGDYKRGVQDFWRAYEIRRDILGERHADTREALGKYLASGYLPGPAAASRVKLARHYVALEKDADPRSVQAIQARVILAKTLGPRRSLDERRQLLNEAEEIALQTLGPTHAATLTVEQSMAQVLMESGQYAAAEARLRELLRIRRSGPDPENQFLLGTKLELGTLLARTGRPSEGERLIREAYAVQIRVLGAAHPATITSIQSLAECKLAQGECSAARQLVAELIDFLLDSYPADEYRVFEARGIQQFIENGIAD